MKKLLFYFLFCIICAQDAFAQSQPTAGELKFRNGIEQFLKEEGYVPTIDSNNNRRVNFKKEGIKYWITVKDSEPCYVTMQRSGFTMDEGKRDSYIEACNYANLNKRCGKASIDTEDVFFTVEFYCYSIENFRSTFYRNMNSLEYIKEATMSYYNEHN